MDEPPPTLDRYGKRAGAASALIHVTVIALLFSLPGVSPPVARAPARSWHLTRLVSPLLPSPSQDGASGGGNGSRAPLPASFGAVPPVADHTFAPPIPVARDPSFILTVEPTLTGPVELRLPNVDARDWGDPSALPGPPSPGTGCCTGIGTASAPASVPATAPDGAPAPAATAPSSCPAGAACRLPSRSTRSSPSIPKRRARPNSRAPWYSRSSSTSAASRPTSGFSTRLAWGSTRRPSKPSASGASAPA